MLNNPTKKTEFLFDIILILTIFFAILLLGNYGIFLGHNFFVNEPAYSLYGFHAGNTFSSGWRPDIGLGQSFFFGDPGTFHVWALFRWWAHLFPSPLAGFKDFTKTDAYCNHIGGRSLTFLCVAMHALFYSTAYLTHPKRIFRLLRNLVKKRFEPSNVFEQRIYDVFAREKHYASKTKTKSERLAIKL